MTPEQWTLAESLYLKATAVAADERHAWLARACGGDEVVRREVMSLLAQDPSVTSPLDGHALAAVAGGVRPESLVGRTIGGYEFLSLIDEGGMGQVYRARDPHLPRDVAIKVILPTSVDDPVRRTRFRREADTLAAFAHPHIAQIYAFVEADGRSLLAMELVPGETLADRIGRGPMPVRDAMVIAEQIADALDAAHEQGVIHRDLKPANIRITPDGVVKVLDFGLATSRRPAAAAETVTLTHTVPGMLLGTVAYMSPEQARGEAVDKRTDVWAFGCVLFEMVTGRKPFAGSTTSDVLTTILEADPDWSQLPASLPERMRDLLRRCLDKDRKRRLRDIGEARVMLDDELRAAPTPGWMARGQSLSVPRSSVTRWALQAAALLLMTLTGAAAAVYFRPAPSRQPRPVARLSIPLNGDAALSISGFARDMSLTPDGSSLVYVGNHATQLFVRRLDSVKPVPIATGQSMSFPFVSPDGQWVGYLDGNYVMKKVAITGGPSTTLDGRGRGGATWLPDNTIVVGGLGNEGLIRVSAVGATDTGVGEALTRPDASKNEASHRWPVALPGGQAVLFTITAQSGGLDAARIAVLDLRTLAQKIVLQGGSDGRYVTNPTPVAGEPSGFLVYLAQGLLRSIPFDLTRLETSGTAVAVNIPVMSFPGADGNFDIDPEGTLVLASSPASVAEAPRSVVWVDRSGHESVSGVPDGPYLGVKISPDGKRLAFLVLEKGQRRLLVWDVERKAPTRLRFEPGVIIGSPLWTATGDQIVFQAWLVGENVSMWRMAASGIGSPERLATSANPQLATSLTSDHHVVFHEATPRSSLDILQLALDGEHTITPLLHSTLWETNGVVSPDGHWLAYECCDVGSLEIHVRPYPNVQAGEWQVSNAGGRRPMWSQAGNELFFVESDGTMMSVSFDVSGSLWHPRTPARVFPAGFLWSEFTPAEATSYDLARDARRFLVIKAPAAGATAPPDVLLIQNWSEELPALSRPR